MRFEIITKKDMEDAFAKFEGHIESEGGKSFFVVDELKEGKKRLKI